MATIQGGPDIPLDSGADDGGLGLDSITGGLLSFVNDLASGADSGAVAAPAAPSPKGKPPVATTIQGGPDTSVQSGAPFGALLSALGPVANTVAGGLLAQNAAKSAGKAVKGNSTTILLIAGGGGLLLLLVVAMFAFRRK